MRDYLLVTFLKTAQQDTIDSILGQLPYEKESILEEEYTSPRRRYVLYAPCGKLSELVKDFAQAVSEHPTALQKVYSKNTRF